MSEDKIAGPHFEVTLDTNQTDAAASKFDGNINKMAASATKLKNNLDPAERGITGLTNKIKSLSPEAATEKLNKLAIAAERAGGSSVKGAAQIEFLQKRIETLSAAGGRIPASLEGISTGTNKITTALQGLNQSGAATMVGLPPAFGRVAAAATSAGGMALAAGVAVIGVGVASTNTAMEFESAFARVKRVITPAIADVGALRDGLLDMSTKIPVAATDLAKIASMAGQMGITGTENILKFTETVARLGVTADMSGEEAAKMLARIAQVNNIPIDKIDHLASAVLGVGAKSNATTDEILRMTLQMQQLGSQAGLSAADMIGLSATLAAGGVRVESAGTAMGRMARDINQAVAGGTKGAADKLQELAHVSDMSAEQFKEAWAADKAGVLLELFKGLQDEGDKAAHALELLGWQGVRVAGSAGVLSKTTKDLAANISEANHQMSENQALMAQSNTVFGTSESSFTKLKDAVSVFGTEIGSTTLGPLKSMLDMLTSIVTVGSKMYRIQAAAQRGAATTVWDWITTGGRPEEHKAWEQHQAAMNAGAGLRRPGVADEAIDVTKGLYAPFQMKAGPLREAAAPEPMSDAQKKAEAHAAERRIELEKELGVALAKTKVGIEAVIEAIEARRRAEIEKINSDSQLSPSEKTEFTGIENKIAAAQRLKAFNDDIHKQDKEKLKLVISSERFTREMMDLTDQAQARESSGLERILAQIDAKILAKKREMLAETDPERKAQHLEEIKQYEIIAKAAAIEHNAMEQRKRGAEMAASSEKEYYSTLDKISPSLEYKTKLLYADISAQWRSINAQHEKGDIDDETYARQVAWLTKILGLNEDLLKKQHQLNVLNGIATRLNTIAGLMSEVGGITGNDTMARIGASAQKGSSIGGTIGGLFGPMGAAVGQIAGGLIGGLGSAIFGKAPEFKKIMEDVGHSWGKAISEGTAKAIAETESTMKVSRAVAELLNISKIMADNPEIDPSTYATKIMQLADAIDQGRAPAKAGIAELGKDFLALKEEAEGGSVAARNAMTQLMAKAKELGLAVPEIEAAISAGVERATSNLAAFFEGQGTSQRAGHVTGMSAESAKANLTIFDAVFEANVALDGLIVASERTKEAFDTLTSGLPEGTELFGGAARASQINTLLENSPLFKGSVQTATAGAQVLGGLGDANALNQNTVDAFSTILTQNMEQSIAGTEMLDISPEERLRLAEEANLPLLTEMQHARASGLTLSPEAEEALRKAEEDGILPALSIAEQQLLVEKEIRDLIRGGNGANPHDENTSTETSTGTGTGTGAGSGNGTGTGTGQKPPNGSANYDFQKFGDGGKVSYTPGGMPIVVGEKSTEYIIPEDKMKNGFGGGSTLNLSLGGMTVVSSSADPVQVGEATVQAIERNLVPRLRTLLLGLE